DSLGKENRNDDNNENGSDYSNDDDNSEDRDGSGEENRNDDSDNENCSHEGGDLNDQEDHEGDTYYEDEAIENAFAIYKVGHCCEKGFEIKKMRRKLIERQYSVEDIITDSEPKKLEKCRKCSFSIDLLQESCTLRLSKEKILGALPKSTLESPTKITKIKSNLWQGVQNKQQSNPESTLLSLKDLEFLKIELIQRQYFDNKLSLKLIEKLRLLQKKGALDDNVPIANFQEPNPKLRKQPNEYQLPLAKLVEPNQVIIRNKVHNTRKNHKLHRDIQGQKEAIRKEIIRNLTRRKTEQTLLEASAKNNTMQQVFTLWLDLS
ncbi:7772_t:CDS:2, partial [Gigaspora margarita]